MCNRACSVTRSLIVLPRRVTTATRTSLPPHAVQYIIGASSVARAWSGYLDTLTNGAISGFLSAHVPAMTVPGLAAYPDLLAFAVTMLLTVVCALGARESTMVNNVLTVINLVVIAFVICAGAVYGRVANLTPFAPAGFNGIFAGAATSFFAYVGFDVIATSAEEAKNPSRTVPLGIVGSLGICAVLYLLISGVFATMLPFPYDGVDLSAPLASAFALRGANWASYIISVGAVCGLTTVRRPRGHAGWGVGGAARRGSK